MLGRWLCRLVETIYAYQAKLHEKRLTYRMRNDIHCQKRMK